MRARYAALEAEARRLERLTVTVPAAGSEGGRTVRALEYLARPEGSFEALAARGVASPLAPELRDALAVRVKYRGYIERELRTAAAAAALGRLALPEALWYEPLAGLSSEAREKLRRWRPATVAQAARISGVSPADVAVLLVHARRHAGVRAAET